MKKWTVRVVVVVVLDLLWVTCLREPTWWHSDVQADFATLRTPLSEGNI